MRGRLVEDRIEERICKIRVIDGVIANYYPQEELIRCKDCKHCLNYCRIIEDRKYDYACALKEEYGYPYGRFRVNENDFCSRAERKEE